jgi:predicted GIY-YIG superfamily endonuclease
MPFWCYIVRCADGPFYTGHTDMRERRIGQHQVGGYCKFTSTRRPVQLAWCQEFPARLEALEAERRISPWSRRKKEALIASDWAALSHWAKPPFERVSPQCPSTSLGTNGQGASSPGSLVPSQVQSPNLPSSVPVPPPFVPSEVEAQA